MTEPKRPRRVWQPDPPARKSRAPTPLGVLVDPAREAFAKQAGVVIDGETWRRAVGDRIASRAEPGWLKGSVLTVVAASATWAQELSLLSEDIKQRLAAHGLTLRAIRFIVRDGAGYQGEAKRPRRVAREALPPELREQLRKVSDPELAAAIAEAAGFSLTESTPPKAGKAPGRGRASERPDARDPRDAEARSDRSGRASKRGPARS
ncbi:MAG TPA: DUF721 domain-containing protein [Polyangiaceae bacterium]|nr:DUF721 domain-containing protein [Polyangiaceae bacterium]